MAVRPLVHPPFMGRHRVAMPMGFSGFSGLPAPSTPQFSILPWAWDKLSPSVQSQVSKYSVRTQIDGAPPGFRALATVDYTNIYGQPVIVSSLHPYGNSGFRWKAGIIGPTLSLTPSDITMDLVNKYKGYADFPNLDKWIRAAPVIPILNYSILAPNGTSASLAAGNTIPVDLAGALKALAFQGKSSGWSNFTGTFRKMIQDPAVWKAVAVLVAAPLAVSQVIQPAIAAAGAASSGGAAAGAASSGGAAAGAAPLPAAFTATPQALTASYYGGATLAPAAATAPIITGITTAVAPAISAPTAAAITAGKAAPSLLTTITGAGATLAPIAQTAAQVAPILFAPSGGGGAPPAPVDTGQAAAPAPPPGLPSGVVPAILLGGALLVAYMNM